MDRFSYIVPPSPTIPTTVVVDSYYPTSNWVDGKWAYQDLSYMLHDPALSLPMEIPHAKKKKKKYFLASGTRKIGGAIPIGVPVPSFVKPPTESSSDSTNNNNEKKESSHKVLWYVAGGLLLAGVAGYAIHRGMKSSKKLKIKTHGQI